MSERVGLVLLAVILTAFAVVIGFLMDGSGTLSIIFAITVMGAFNIYAVLYGKGDKRDEKKPDDKPDKQD